MTKDRPCAGCSTLVYRDSKTGLCKACYAAKTAVQPAPVVDVEAPAATLAADREKRKLVDEVARLKARYSESLKTIEAQEADLRAMNVMASGQASFEIVPKSGQGNNEGTAVIVASDWHIEERVGAEVGGLNTYSLDIAKGRITKFFQAALNLVQLLQVRIDIPTIILALLGDFITNAEMHGGDNAESCALPPTAAVIEAQNALISGIDFLLANTTADFVIPCHSGNHARTTHKIRFAAENGHSLEYLMYLTLASVYRHEKRITFIIPEGMHSYVTLYDGAPGKTTIRFQHGHAMKYGGGVGGIYIPINKAVNQYNKAKHADLDVMGHFHSLRDGGNFIVNGSLIGYNAFALSIRADFEAPRQALFLIDRKRGRTCMWPIIL